MGKFFEAVGNRNVGTGAGQMEKILARTSSTFIFPNLLQQVDKIFDPTVRQQTDLQALLQSQVPFVRRLNQPVLNALGEPVESQPFHLWFSETKPDELWQAVAAQKAWIPDVGHATLVGNKRLGPDYVRAITPDEIYELTAVSGPKIREALEAHLDTGDRHQDINAMEPAQAKRYVQKVTEEQRKKALERLDDQ